ncbi:hypothetical protein DDZ14_12920 [Maritimibacter sp. 55A14]|uniref:carbon-nitrogen hydrolase family protein n=1 Tax=Maritimibacter sp. 55A14 TaxID=2174844 RepID=UPI000D606AF4|nr:carbon-nitrogen hydrolase family protein [Maritimibacter sp. 55A14]PWE31410.1 hypothetical protein DDZ14_12920 [Maritimibacter sp. 55A14]
MTLRLGLWQGAGVPGDLDATVAEAARVAELAAAEGAQLLIFPEGFLTGYHLPDLSLATLPDVEPALEQIAGIAARAGLHLVMGSHVADTAGLRNAAIAYSATGAELCRYHKRALYGDWERATFVPGDRPARFDCAGLRVGLLICYDVEFPELVRAEARAGADLLAIPTANMAPFTRIPLQMVPVRAMENQLFIAYANRSGSEHELDFVGLSSIRGPEGEALAEAGAGPQLLIADIDPKRRSEARREFSYLDDLARLEGRQP